MLTGYYVCSFSISILNCMCLVLKPEHVTLHWFPSGRKSNTFLLLLRMWITFFIVSNTTAKKYLGDKFKQKQASIPKGCSVGVNRFSFFVNFVEFFYNVSMG